MTDRRRACAFICSFALAWTPVTAPASNWVAAVQGLLSESPARLTVLLVDTTGSISADDWALYERAAGTVFEELRPGDRVVLARVADKPASKFLVHADRSFKVSGNSMQDDVRVRRLRDSLKADFASLRDAASPPATGTLLIDAVGAVGEWFGQGRASGNVLDLVVLSDMIEESPLANFAKEPVTPGLTDRLMATLRKQGLLPDLGGVRVHAVGASGSTAVKMAQVRGFWQAYFAATGATLQSYGRSAASVAR